MFETDRRLIEDRYLSPSERVTESAMNEYLVI